MRPQGATEQLEVEERRVEAVVTVEGKDGLHWGALEGENGRRRRWVGWRERVKMKSRVVVGEGERMT